MKEHFKYNNVDIRRECEDVERKERKLAQYDPVSGEISFMEFKKILTQVHYREDKVDADIFADHYCSKAYDHMSKIDYNAFIADMSKPKGAAFNPQFGSIA